MKLKSRHSFYFVLCIIVALFFCAVVSASADIESKVRDATDGFRDISLTCRVISYDIHELQKIGKDIPRTYEIKRCTISFKTPDKMKVEGKLGILRVDMIQNGNLKSFRVPGILGLGYSKTENIKGQPHKRQTEFDLGILTASLWRDYIVLDAEIRQGPKGPEYKIEFVRSNARGKKLICWTDAATFKIWEVEKYDDGGRLKSKYLYSDHREVNGIWVPGRIQVYNQDGRLAGTTAYENVKVNTGIPDSYFRIR